MGSFENTLDRMKALYTYGKDINESKKINSYSLEHKATAADGITYGIIRECNKYYIKKAQPGKEAIAESYQYLGGFCNKGNYEYDSYNKAVKNFELKLASINEAHDGNVVISTLDPFKKGEFIVEGTERMKDVIARQRQIMHNVSMIMNESSTIGASRKNDVVKYDGKNPEAETGKRGDEGMTAATAKPDYAGSKTNGVDKKVGPFNENPGKCEDQLKESCDCGEENCSCDWGSEGIGKGRDPKQIGWEMEGQTVVNEEEQDWASVGLPSTPGVGEADTDHNNNPFNKTVNEGEEFDAEDDVEVDTTADETGDEDFGSEDFDVEDFDSEEDIDIVDNDIDLSDEEMPEESDGDIMSRIAELEAELEALKAQVDGGDEFDAEGDEFDAEGDEFDAEGDMDMDIDTTEGGEDVSDFEADFDTVDDSEFDAEGGDFGTEGEESFDEMDECGDMSLMEAKKAYMNHIVESVVAHMINEDELHVFGKHPGYQKKPMELPTTGEDNNQWGEDWNDESVYSEEPFGTKIGSSAPFDKLVDTVTKDVMSQISGEAFKKKVK